VEVLSIILSKKDMLCCASHNCSKSQQTELPTPLLPEINIVSSLTLPSGLKKKKKEKEKNVPVCDEQRSGSPWECSQRINILLPDSVTVSWNTFYLPRSVPMWNVQSLGYPTGDDRLTAAS
jgi:hypothetical protein